MHLAADPLTWTAFVRSPHGIAAAFAATVALLLVGLEAEPPEPTFALTQLLLVFIALGCVASMAFRDRHSSTSPIGA